jgi:hypothetical protein
MISIDDIISHEQGDMEEDQMVDFFQNLIDTGAAWSLQGHYGRTAASLISAGICTQ